MIPTKLYSLFLVMAAATVCSPGPGVVMTLRNALRHGLRGAFGGIVGLSCGALLVAATSATGAGVVLATSPMAFTIMKYVGAGYLVTLGIKVWRAPVVTFQDQPSEDAGFGQRFLEGLTLQLTNPKAIFFFLSVFPQFIDRAGNYKTQFAILIATYSSLVIAIHTGYGLTAQRARLWLTSERGAKTVNRLSGTMFFVFGAAMAAASR